MAIVVGLVRDGVGPWGRSRGGALHPGSCPHNPRGQNVFVASSCHPHACSAQLRHARIQLRHTRVHYACAHDARAADFQVAAKVPRSPIHPTIYKAGGTTPSRSPRSSVFVPRRAALVMVVDSRYRRATAPVRWRCLLRVAAVVGVLAAWVTPAAASCDSDVLQFMNSSALNVTFMTYFQVVCGCIMCPPCWPMVEGIGGGVALTSPPTRKSNYAKRGCRRVTGVCVGRSPAWSDDRRVLLGCIIQREFDVCVGVPILVRRTWWLLLLPRCGDAAELHVQLHQAGLRPDGLRGT